MIRIYLDHPCILLDHPLPLSHETQHYVCHVMRLRQDDPLLIFNGRDGLFKARLMLHKKMASVVPIVLHEPQPAPTNERHLFFSPIKRLSFLLEKATELGATHLYPCLFQRTVVRDFSVPRAQKILQEACEQSHRLSLPSLFPLAPLRQHLALYQGPLWVCDPKGQTYAPSPLDQAGFVVGPEGGLHQDDLALLDHHPKLSLGPLVLRAETAVCACLSLSL